ncbi:hypothetical protein BA895_08830 [Humibacillus sp. DSM 29435]|uniref:hypothetical protein n=1 Tax=Humibacillus sp. DSM 29435 TaxID=1869167 RepID=UPI000873145D|nr:hypothetical protein [Humibacillus sp. DSM 29435]OFE14775.1 hypothetical protein BA895_08830 [Humibacillus sp. DSM 29435]
MNPDITELLETASADVREVDLVERSWAGAQRRRSRRRRTSVAGVAAAAVVAVVAGTFAAGRTTPPPTPAPSVSQTATATAWRLAPDGTRYVVAPPLGTEGGLPTASFTPVNRLEKIDPTATRRELADVIANDPSWRGETPIAAFIEAVDAPSYADATTFQPVFALLDGSLVTTDVRLGWVRDTDGNRSVPLATGSLSFRGVAFAQPGRIITLDLTTGTVKTHSVPSQTIEQVRWAGTKVVASGDGGAWQIDTAAASPTAEKLPEGYTGAKNVIGVDPTGAPSVTFWELEGLRKTPTAVSAPVTQTNGQTFSTNLSAASGVFLSDGLDAGDGVAPSQGILSVTLYDPSERRLLVMGESPARSKGCCQVVGYSIEQELLYTNTTADGVWLLQWNPDTGLVSRVALLEADPAVPAVLSFGFNIAN